MSRPPRRAPRTEIEGRARYVAALRLGVRALADRAEAADARMCPADAEEARRAGRELDGLAFILDRNGGHPSPRPRAGREFLDG